MTTRITTYMRRNVLALLAIVLALSSGAYAASLAKNSVGSKQIKAGAVKSDEVADGALLDDDFAAGQLPRGDTGAQGPRGATGPQGVAGTNGTDGADGADGTNGTNGTNGTDGDDGSPDTAEEVLGKLITVDGPGSALSADSLDGLDSKDFARLGGVVNGDGTVVQGTGFTVSHPNAGEYQVSFPQGTLGSTCPPIVTVLPFSGLVRVPTITGRTCSGLGAGNFTVKLNDTAGTSHDTPFLFIAM